MTWASRARAELESIRSSGRHRSIRDFDAFGPRGTLDDGRAVVSFASNDYLGLTTHPDVIAAATAALHRWGSGSGAARLIVGARPVHSELEAAIAEWKQTERALVWPTGFAANLSVLATLADETTTIFSDELNHASIVDGCRLARGRVLVYPHGDAAALERALGTVGRAIVVSDLIFSMDGDVAPIDELVEICARHEALLVVDEAHAVLGPHPDFGRAEVLRVGTLSKTLGALGGFVAGPATLIDLLINRARPFIFTTAPSPADSAAALAALRVLGSAEGTALLAKLRAHVDVLARSHPSPIIPIVLGDEERALEASGRLLERGFLVPAIRPPSVSEGTSRLRITVSAAHTDDEVSGLAAALAHVVEVARV